MYSVSKNLSQDIKITFYHIVTEMWRHQKWQFDKIWFYKFLICDSFLNLLLQTWVLRLPMGQKLVLESPLKVIPNCDSPIERSPPIVHMKKQTRPLALKYDPPPIFMGGEDNMPPIPHR